MGLAGLKVLVLEDEYFIAEDIVEALEEQGATVIGPFADAPAASAALTGETPQLAILDINLHGAMSFEVAALLSDRGIPFIFATGYEATNIPARFASAPLWRKPFASPDLVAALSKLGV